MNGSTLTLLPIFVDPVIRLDVVTDYLFTGGDASGITDETGAAITDQAGNPITDGAPAPSASLVDEAGNPITDQAGNPISAN